MIGGVGQRMLTGVSRKMAGEFFTALDDDIAGRRAPVAPVPVPGVPVPAGTPAVGETFTGRAATAAPAASTRDLVVAAVAGGLLALAGVALGARIARRR